MGEYLYSINPYDVEEKMQKMLGYTWFWTYRKIYFQENKDLVNIIKDINKMQEPLKQLVKQLVKINRNEGSMDSIYKDVYQ